MIELHLIGYTSDLRYVVLDLDPEGDRGRYRLVVDGDLLLTLDELRDLRAHAGMDVGVPYERLEERLGVTIGRDVDQPEAPTEPVEPSASEPAPAGPTGPAPTQQVAPEPDPAPPLRIDRPAPVEPSTAQPPTSLPPPRPASADGPSPAFRLVEGPRPSEEAPVGPEGDGRPSAGPSVPGPEPAQPVEREREARAGRDEPEEPEPEDSEEPDEPEEPAVAEPATRAGDGPPARDESPDRADGVAMTRDAGPAAGRDSELSPAQIQARLRAGRRPESVAEEAGTDVEWVERWLPPILTERAQVLGEARSLHLVRPRKGRSHDPLGDAVAANLRRRHLDPEEDAEWSVKRRASGRWSINVRYRYRGKARSATWALDREEGELTPSSQAARELGWTDRR